MTFMKSSTQDHKICQQHKGIVQVCGIIRKRKLSMYKKKVPEELYPAWQGLFLSFSQTKQKLWQTTWFCSSLSITRLGINWIIKIHFSPASHKRKFCTITSCTKQGHSTALFTYIRIKIATYPLPLANKLFARRKFLILISIHHRTKTWKI